MRTSRRLPVFRRLCALEQLALQTESRKLIPFLLAKGLAPEDAIAVSYNAALLCRTLDADPPLESPRQTLERYGLREIAELCELYRQVETGELEYGEAAT